jgi:hypothetical protein
MFGLLSGSQIPMSVGNLIFPIDRCNSAYTFIFLMFVSNLPIVLHIKTLVMSFGLYYFRHQQSNFIIQF